jgi:glycosyltransferase involved in cell wall biosynthesis
MNPALFAPILEGSRSAARAGRGRVLFIAPSRALTFVEHDVEILARGREVEVLTRQDLPSRRRLLPAVLRRFAARRYDLLFIWFADPYDTPSLLRLARLFRVPSAVVVGGYEVTALPAIGYGALVGRRARRRLRLALRLAGAVLPTSRLLATEALALGAPAERIRVIPPGIDCDFFTPPEEERDGPAEIWSGPEKERGDPAERAQAAGPREPLVVTVGTISEATWQVKGLDVFATCARLLPEARFAILGPCEEAALAEELRRRAGGNLEIPGRRLGAAELRDWYRRATVYAQLSRRESFGVALAEAMACACAPVASDAGALPALVGAAGSVVPVAKPRTAARAIAAALAAGPAPAARRRIQELFAAPLRARALGEVVDGMARRSAAGRSGLGVRQRQSRVDEGREGKADEGRESESDGRPEGRVDGTRADEGRESSTD